MMIRNRSRLVRQVGLVAGLLTLLGATTHSVRADQVVYFVNGKAMMVKSVQKGDKFSVLEVEGGGKIGVPTEQIDRIEEYQVQAPAAAVPVAVAPTVAVSAPSIAPSPAAPAPGPVAQGQLVPGAQPLTGAPAGPATSLPSGPGYGGRPDLGQQAIMGNLNPIAIGGESNAPPVPRPQPGLGMGGPGGAGGARFMNAYGPARAGLGPRGYAPRLAGRGGGAGQRRIPDLPAPPTSAAPPPAAAAPPPVATPPPPEPQPDPADSTPDPAPDPGASNGDDPSPDQG